MNSRDAKLLQDVHDALPAQIAHNARELEALGVTDSKAVELEFTAQIDSAMEEEQAALAERQRADLRIRVFDHIREDEGITPSARMIRTTEASDFPIEAMLMYELVYMDPRTSPFLMNSFGIQRDHNSFFDAVNVRGRNILEARFERTDPSVVDDGEMYDNIKTFVEVLHEKAEQYGLKIEGPGVHLNISFWKDGKNLFDFENPDYETLGSKVMGSFLKAADMAGPLTDVPRMRCIDVHRNALIRVTGTEDSARAEFRLGGLTRDGLEKADIPLLVEGFIKPHVVAALKLDKQYTDLTQVTLPDVERTNQYAFKVISNLLESTELSEVSAPEDRPGVKYYKLDIPDFYVGGEGRAESLLKELGLTDVVIPEADPPVVGFHRILHRMGTKEVKDLLAFFNEMRIEEEDGKFKFVIPDKLGEAVLPARIRKALNDDLTVKCVYPAFKQAEMELIPSHQRPPLKMAYNSDMDEAGAMDDGFAGKLRSLIRLNQTGNNIAQS